MALSDKDREKLAFDSEWQRMVQLGAELKRWKPDVMGPAIEDYREAPAGEYIEATLEDIKEFLEKEAGNEGLTEGAFWMEVAKHAAKEQKTAKRADEINFYDQLETELAVKQNIEHKRTDLSGKDVQYSVSKIFKRTLGILGFLPKMKGKFKGEKISILGKKLAPERFEDLEKQIIERNHELAEIDASLAQYADEISKQKAKLDIKDLSDEEEKRIRLEIKSIQGKTARLIDLEPIQKTVSGDPNTKKSKTEEIQKLAKKQNLLIGLIKNELEKEAKVITKKWGRKVQNRLKTREKLVAELDRLENGGSDQAIAEIGIQIRDVNVELQKLKEQIINYKAKNPIFLYERFVGVESIPVLKPTGQASSILGGMEMPTVSRPPNKLPKNA